MQYLLFLLAILGGGAFWWYRMRNIADAASDIHDVAGRAWGKYKRAKFRGKVEDSPLEAVDDPIAAAVVTLLTVAKNGYPMSDRAENLIKSIAADELRADELDELMTFATWVAKHAVDPNDLTRRYAKLWAGALNMDERRSFVDMVKRVAEVDGIMARENAVVIAKLKERLGLQV
jgi:uncharacterized tellurite resistance protein B-like protein